MGCAASVRGDLEKFEEIRIVELDPRSATGKFEIAEGFDYKSILAKLSETNSHIDGWSIAD
ncbi:MAG: hypothetical protein ACR2NM_12085 [Bythopirellula sp.]